MKIHEIRKCLGCNAKYRKAVTVKEGKANWSIPAYCEKCRTEYLSYLQESDAELETLKPIHDEIMEGWTEKDRRAHCVANKPRRAA